MDTNLEINSDKSLQVRLGIDDISKLGYEYWLKYSKLSDDMKYLCLIE